MLMVVARRTPDGGFEDANPVVIERPGEEEGESTLDAFARWAAKRYRAEMERKEKAHE